MLFTAYELYVMSGNNMALAQLDTSSQEIITSQEIINVSDTSALANALEGDQPIDTSDPEALLNALE